MVQIGKTYGNLMVDLNSYACRKLTERATRVVGAVTGLSFSEAETLLASAHGRAKAAIVMHQAGTSYREAQRLLATFHGRVRDVLDRVSQP